MIMRRREKTDIVYILDQLGIVIELPLTHVVHILDLAPQVHAAAYCFPAMAKHHAPLERMHMPVVDLL